jgi:3-phytase
MQKILLFLGVISFLFSCQPSSNNQEDKEAQIDDADLEAHEDSMALVRAYAAQAKIIPAITADVETKAIKANNQDDAADDPAIWVNPADPSASLIYGSNKKGGLAVYNLQGAEVAYYPIGNINNVDVLYDYPLDKSNITLVGCSNRSKQSIELFRIDPKDGALQDIAEGTLKMDSTKIDDIYGFAFAKDLESGKSYAVINGKNGRLQQYEIIATDDGKLSLTLSREVQFDSQTEGMVADNEQGVLYVGEEGRGVWKLQLSPESGDKKSLLEGSGQTNPNIVYDVEGLTLYKKDNTRYLFVSSQGNFSYAIFEGNGDNKYLKSFKIVDAASIDGVEETDGLDVVSDSLSEKFPKGLLVVQDGFNYDGDSQKAQNFKLISLEKVMEIISLE